MPRNGLPSALDTALTEAESTSFGLPPDLIKQFEKQDADAKARKIKLQQEQTIPQPVNIGTGKSYKNGVPFQTEFFAAAQRYNVPVNVLMGLAEQESRFNPSALGTQTEWGRAKGLLQYLDSTAQGMGINPYDPAQSIDAAAKQLRQRLDKGYSMIDAVREHFAGPDRKKWGKKTTAYGNEVMARAARFQGYAPSDQPAAVPQQSTTQTAKQPSTIDQLNAKEPNRYRPLSESEIQRMQEAQSQGLTEFVPFGGAKPIKIGQVPAAQSQQPKANQDAGFWSDTGNLLLSGWNSSAEGAREIASRIPGVKHLVNAVDQIDLYFTGKTSQQLMDEAKAKYEGAMSEKTNEARKKLWVVEPGDKLADGTTAKTWGIGDAWKDPRAYYAGIVESLPEMAVTMGGSMSIAKGTFKRAIASGVSRDVAAKKAATTATIAGGLLEGGFGGAHASVDVRKEIKGMSQDALKNSEAMKALMAEGKSFDQARDQIANDAATKAFVLAGIGTGIFGGMGDRALAQIITKGTKSRLKSAATGAVAEGLLEEMPQSALQQVAQNYAVQDADPSRPLSKGVANQAVGGAVLGGIMGGGIGAAGHRSEIPAAATEQPAEAVPQPVDTPAEVVPEQVVQPEQQQPARKVGPIERALGGEASLDAAIDTELAAVQEADKQTKEAENKQAGGQWLGEPGTVTQISPKADPESVYTVTVEGYENGEVFARDQDGTPMQFGQDDIVAQPQSKPAEEQSNDVQTASGLPANDQGVSDRASQEDASPAAAQGSDTAVSKTEQEQSPGLTDFDYTPQQPAKAGEDPNLSTFDTTEGQSVDTPPVQAVEIEKPEKTLGKMNKDELDARMKYLVTQAKTNGGWDKRLMAERRKIETALSKLEKKQAEATETTVQAQPDATLTDEGTTPSNFKDLILDAHANNPAKKAQIIADEIKATGRSRSDVFAEVSKIVGEYDAKKPKAEAQPVAQPAEVSETAPDTTEAAVELPTPLKGADGKPKWFFSREKAEAFITKKKLGKQYQVNEVSKNRFEIHPIAAATQETAPSNVAPTVTETATKEPKAQQAKKDKPIRNYSWDRVKMANNLTLEELDQLKRQVEEGHANARDENGQYLEGGQPTINLYDKKGRKKLDDISWAVYHKTKKREGDQAADTTPAREVVKNTTTEAETLPAQAENVPADTETLPGAKAKPSANTLVTDDRAAELRARLKSKLSQLNSGIDPEILAIGAELAVYHIERGARTFAAFAKNVAADLDVTVDKVRPYLRSWYNGARDMIEDMGGSIEGMDNAETVRSELAKLDASEQTPADEPKGITWAKDPGADNTWLSSDGKVVSREPFEYNGTKMDVFNIYQNKEEQSKGNYVATKDSLQKAKDYADQLTRKQGENNVPGTEQRVESDRGNTEARESVVSDTDGTATEGNGQSTERTSGRTDGEQRTRQRDQRVPGDSTATGREPGNQRVHRENGQFEPTERPARSAERSGSRVDSSEGQSVERERTRAVIADAHSAGTDELSQRLKAQKKADKAPTKWGDKASIDAALPLLLSEQRDDVFKAETRFAGHNGILFTNGTGTGKTATGLGIVKRFINDGKDNVVVVVPSDKIASDWVKFAKMLNIELKQLDGVEDNGGSGPIVTTYANFGQNDTLAQRDWDLVIPDESHYLSSNEAGDSTAALDQLRGLTGHHRGFYDWVRRRHAKEWKAWEDARQALADLKESDPKYAKLKPAEEAAGRKWRDLESREREKWDSRWAAQKDLPKVAFLSATPFAYVKNTDYAEGYLFHYVQPAALKDSQGQGGGYNSGSPRDHFMMERFGYRMRYNKLTAPESGVNSQLLEQQFNEQLKKEGALSGRKLEVPFDYDRKFVLVDDAVGTKIDNALKYLREQSLEAEKRAREANGDQAALTEAEHWRNLFNVIDKRFDYQSRMYLLESIKAKAAVPMIRDYLKSGRKVVVFHDYNQGGGFDPFTPAMGSELAPGQREFNQRVLASRPDLFKLDLKDLRSATETLTEAFPNALLFSGNVSKAQRRANADTFNDDDGKAGLIVIQSDAGREGVSLHDTTGKFQRVEINLGMPVKPVAATQIEGRTYRTGQASDAMFRYLTTGTGWEASAFASKIAERASTAENLALGSEARGLKDAFIDAYQSATGHELSENDGKGGKDYDRKMSASNTVTPFDKAKTFYWAQQKNSKKRDQREGVDYFATPEPVGFKMVEWANIKPGDKALEPSAGHGAIARFFPEQADVTMIEPSYDLSQRAGLANGNARIINDVFENLHINNKYDAIVMNPPYGSGGKLSTEHIAKAATHLRDAGRIVALIPRGGMADTRLQQFLGSEQAADLYVVAKVKMPPSTFERAGTAVNTQVLILEKHKNKDDAAGIIQRNVDLSDAKTVNELFDGIEQVSMPDRKPSTTPEPKLEIVEHTNAFGKTIRGTIVTGMLKAEAQQIDPYTFRKKTEDGKQGWFIREKWFGALPEELKFSRQDEQAVGMSANDVRVALNDRFGAETVAKLEKAGTLTIADTYDVPGVEGYSQGGKVTLVGSALTPDTVVPVFLHELGGHVGMQGVMKPTAYKNLMENFNRLVEAKDPIALEAKRLAERETDPNARQDEYLPYLITAAARAQNKRPGIRTLVSRIVAAVKAWAVDKLGIDLNLNANDVLALAERMVGTISNRDASAASDIRFSRQDDDLAPVSEQEYASKLNQWWDSVKNLSSDKMTKLMVNGALGLIPLRPMLTEMAKDIPAAKTYLRIKDAMDAMRNKWHAKTDAVAQDWLKYRIKNKEENRLLMDIMHESTLMQVDPSKDFESILSTRDKIALADMPEDHPSRKKLEEKRERDEQRKVAHAALKPRFDALSPEAKEIYERVRDTYTDLADAFDKTLLENMEKAINVRIKKAEREYKREMESITDEGLKGQEREDAIAAADRRLKNAKTKIAWNRKARMTQLRQQFETNRLAGPYFPLARFGNLFVTVRDVKSGEVVSFSRFEDPTEQRLFAEEMRKDKNYKVEEGALSSEAATRKAVDPNFVADVEDILADLPNAEKVKDEVWQRYLESLPDMSVRKARIHRKGREGFNADAVRAFGSHMFHGSHQLARMAHSMDLEDALDQAKDDARETKDPVRSGLIVNEMEKRHQFVMSPTGGSLAQWASSFAFVWYLAGSPKAAIMNLFQTPIMGVPILGAYAGGLNGVARAGKELTRALVDFTKGKGFAERSANLSADERRAMSDGYESGIIERTQGHDLAGVGETGVEYSAARERAMKVISWGFHHAERLNREVTFLAAYRLARGKGLDHDAAVRQAGELTWKAHFDYSNTSRPRLMHNDTMKFLLVFRNFQINMLYRLFRDTHQALNGESKEVRKEALTHLAGITGMMMLNAGITGTWLFGIAMVMAGLFADDGEDAEEEFKKAMVNAIGPKLAGLALHGVPGYVSGTSLSGSVGMPDLWFRSPDSEKEGEEALQYWQSQLLGAVPAIGAQFVRGLSYIGKGEEYRGIETMMPKMFKDPMKAYRFATEGAKNMRGDTVTDVTYSDVVKQALGFTPARIAEQYKTNNASYNQQQAILKDRKRLMDGYYKADKEGDEEKVEKLLKDIDKYNEKYPDQAITGRSLIQSRKNREKGAENAVGGMRYNSKLRERLLEGQSPSIYGE